jgi:hypothetical protein
MPRILVVDDGADTCYSTRWLVTGWQIVRTGMNHGSKNGTRITMATSENQGGKPSVIS